MRNCNGRVRPDPLNHSQLYFFETKDKLRLNKGPLERGRDRRQTQPAGLIMIHILDHVADAGELRILQTKT